MSSDDSNGPGEPSEAAAPFQLRNRRTKTTAVPADAPEPSAVDVASDVPEDVLVEKVEPDPEEGPPNRRTPRVGAPVLAVLAVAVVVTVVAFSSWRSAENDPDRDRANLRDNALIEGTENVETMTSMDHRNVAGGIKAWQDVSTGVLHDQLVSIGKDEQQLLADQGKIATGRVVDAALTALTDRTATLITAVEVTVSEDDKTKEPAVKRNRFTADLVLVGGRWKIENLQQVAVEVS